MDLILLPREVRVLVVRGQGHRGRGRPERPVVHRQTQMDDDTHLRRGPASDCTIITHAEDRRAPPPPKPAPSLSASVSAVTKAPERTWSCGVDDAISTRGVYANVEARAFRRWGAQSHCGRVRAPEHAPHVASSSVVTRWWRRVLVERRDCPSRRQLKDRGFTLHRGSDVHDPRSGSRSRKKQGSSTTQELRATCLPTSLGGGVATFLDWSGGVVSFLPIKRILTFTMAPGASCYAILRS